MTNGFARLPIVLPACTPIDAFFSLRSGGCSVGAFGTTEGRDGLNLGAACGDAPEAVRQNRTSVNAVIGRPVLWLRQVHGASVVDADALTSVIEAPQADAAFTTRADIALAILAADCLPIVLAARDGSIVGAAHAGWRGLAGGVVAALTLAMRARCPEADLVAWLGPRIGPAAFEVGDEVRQAFLAVDPQVGDAFVEGTCQGKWMADLGLLAIQALRRAGIDAVHDTQACTVSDPQRFWSYRRDRECGRMAAIVARRIDPATGDVCLHPDQGSV